MNATRTIGGIVWRGHLRSCVSGEGEAGAAARGAVHGRGGPCHSIRMRESPMPHDPRCLALIFVNEGESSARGLTQGQVLHNSPRRVTAVTEKAHAAGVVVAARRSARR
jgi:hypothetical protein